MPSTPVFVFSSSLGIPELCLATIKFIDRAKVTAQVKNTTIKPAGPTDHQSIKYNSECMVEKMIKLTYTEFYRNHASLPTLEPLINHLNNSTTPFTFEVIRYLNRERVKDGAEKKHNFLRALITDLHQLSTNIYVDKNHSELATKTLKKSFGGQPFKHYGNIIEEGDEISLNLEVENMEEIKTNLIQFLSTLKEQWTLTGQEDIKVG